LARAGKGSAGWQVHRTVITRANILNNGKQTDDSSIISAVLYFGLIVVIFTLGISKHFFVGDTTTDDQKSDDLPRVVSEIATLTTQSSLQYKETNY
jgi:hypothetical protein